jgi:O-antigen/teichoic acid export membrane protein
VIQAVREWWDHRRTAASSASAADPRLYPVVLIFALLAILSLLFAFGTPLYAVLYYGLPGWNQLHSPFRWIFPFTLSTAILAGLGVTYLEALVSAKWRADPGQRSLPESTQEPAVTSKGHGLAADRTDEAETGQFLPARPSTLGSLSGYLGWLLFWGGFIGLGVLLFALVRPAPFIGAASLIFERSGLAQHAFADSRQFFGYEWPNFIKLFLMIMAAGAVLRIVGRPIFTPLLKWGRETRISAWKPFVVILVAVDLLLAGAGFNPAVDPALLAFKPEVVDWLETQQLEDPFFRINSFDTPAGRGNKVFLANAGMYSNLFDVRGYDSIIPAQYGRFMQLIQENGDLMFNRIGPLYYDGYAALDSALLDLLGVRYILTTVDLNHQKFDLVYDHEIRVFENREALSRAFLIFEEISPGNDLSLALRSLNPREQLILDGENNQLGRNLAPEDAANSPPATSLVEMEHYTPNEVRLWAQIDRPGWLVLADAYFPGWRAYVSPRSPGSGQLVTANNQQPAISGESSGLNEQGPAENRPARPDPQGSAPEIEVTIHRADGNFRAVYLQPGQWNVRFRYSPRSFQLGLYVSFLTLVLLIFIAGYWTWGKLYREKEDDSPIKRIAKNSLLPMIMALTNRLIDFAFALLMLRILQPEGAGSYAFAVAFIGLAEIIIRFGLGTLVTRDTASSPADSNRYLTNVSVLRVYLWLAALPIMAAVLAFYVAYGGLSLDVVITVVIFAAGTFFSNLSDGITAIFYAHEKAEYPAGVTGVTTLTRVALGALVLILGWGIIGLALASFAANLVAFLVLTYILATKIFRPRLQPDPSLQKEMMGQGFPLMINHLLSTIFFRIDVFILEPTRGSTEVGYYSAAYKYIDGINVIPQYFTLAIFPLMSRFAANSRESLVRAYVLSLRVLLLLALPIAMGTPFVAEELILFLAGRRFLPDSAIVLQILIWFLPFSFINQVTQYVLIAINQQRQLTRAFVIGVLFNSITNLIFIPLYGYRAAAVTTILSEWALLIPFYLLVRRHLCTVPWFDVAWRPTVAAAAMGGCLWFIGDAGFLTTIVIGGSVYLIVLISVGGANQRDMGIIWRVLPLGSLRGRLPWLNHLSES